jgi:hypothetical protein
VKRIMYGRMVIITTILPIIPTGWVNVKIDMEVIKRVRRYSSSLGNTGNDNSAAFTIFRNKLKSLLN